MRAFLITTVVVGLMVGCAPKGDENPGDGPDAPDAMVGGGGIDGGGGNPPPPPNPQDNPGAACDCDADCPADGSHAGICVMGICMTQASGQCSAAGSTAECGAGSRCWGLQGEDAFICWPDCDAYECDGTCDADGSCVPDDTSTCHSQCTDLCPCEPGECSDGFTCVSGSCIPSTSGEGPGDGPGPACPNLPPRDCTLGNAGCGAIGQYSPTVTAHYEDYPINGETAANQYRSWQRQDLRMLVDYATAKTLCKAGSWDTGNGGPLGLGDMSEQNGAIPGTSVGQPGHPAGTHTNGSDIDLGYYQIGQANNRLRPVCQHVSGGQDQYHCMAQPDILDVWRTAMFLGSVFESSRVRVIGVDGQVGPLVVSAIGELCASGWLEASACNNVNLAYETTNMGLGWFQFHHHHAHISVKTTSYLQDPGPEPVMECRVPGCEAPAVKPNPHWQRIFSVEPK